MKRIDVDVLTEGALPQPDWVLIGSTRFWREVGKRNAKCRMCNLPIIKGESRLKTTTRLPNPLHLRNGNKVYAITYFWHPHCLVDRLIGQPEEPKCGSCGRKFWDREHRHRKAHQDGYTRTDGRFGIVVCTDCAKDKEKFVKCWTCRWLVFRSFASPVVDDDNHWCCNACADLHEPDNVLRIIRRREREQKRLDAKVEKITAEYRKEVYDQA